MTGRPAIGTVVVMDVTGAAQVVIPPETTKPPSARDILFGSGPRFARDAFAPVLAFYVGYRLLGLAAGIALATVAGVGTYVYERSHGRPGLMARISLAFVLVQAVVGVISDSATAFLAPQVLLTAVYGLAFFLSAVLGRPLAGAFAAEMVDLPEEVRASLTYRRVFGRISMAWGLFLLARAALRGFALSRGGVDAYVLVNLLTGAPTMPLMVSWSIWYGVRGFRRSEEWGWAFTEGIPAVAAEPSPPIAPAPAAADAS